MAPIATKSDIQDIKEQLSQLLENSARKPSQVSDHEFTPVPLERYIRSLYEQDFGTRESLYDTLFDSRMWYEPGEDSYDLLDRRADFLKAYGEETAERLCLICSQDIELDPNGFTEEEFCKLLHGLHIAVILIMLHKKHAHGEDSFECGIRSDGEFSWRLVTREGKKSSRPKAKLPSRSRKRS